MKYDPFAVPMPEAIAKLPKTARGYPVTFTAFIGPDGVPDLRIIDPHKIIRCVKERLCAICGQPLGYWVIFIGGERSIGNQMFLDPPTHEECARYALKVCPYLAIPGFYHSTMDEFKSEHVITQESQLAAGGQRPVKMGMYFTRQFEFVKVNGETAIKAAPAKKIEWF